MRYRFLNISKHQTIIGTVPSEENIDKIIASNERVISIFNEDTCQELENNAHFHQELEIKILDPVLKTAAITKYHGVESRYVIPSIVIGDVSGGEQYTVVELSSNSFSNSRSLLSIKVPNTVKVIAYSAFSGCHNISSIELSEGLEEIGGSAFMGCRKVQSITIPSTVKKIGTAALTSFKEVILKCPNSVISGHVTRTNCIIIDQAERTDNDTTHTSSVLDETITTSISIDDSEEYLDDFSKLLKRFVKSLNTIQLEYITAIMEGGDYKHVAKKHSIRPTVMEISINEIYSKITDDDSELVSDGVIDDDNIDQLRKVI